MSSQESESGAARRFWGAPRPPRQVESRPRVRALIEEGLETTQGVLLLGPAGSGRTTALADWAHHTTRPGRRVWMQITSECGERRAFWARFLRVLRWSGVLTQQQYTQVADELSQSGGIEALPLLLAQLIEDTGTPVVIVFDGAELLRSMGTGMDLYRLLRHSQLMTAVTAAANLSGEAAERMPPHRVKVIDSSHLALTPDECRAVVSDALGTDAQTVADMVSHATAGWPAAVRLVVNALSEAPRHDWASVIEDTTRAFADQRITRMRLDAEEWRLVTRISLTDPVTVELAAQLASAEVEVAEEYMRRLVLAGLGEWREVPPPRRRVFRFTAVMRPFVRMLHSDLSPEERRAVHSAAADWLVHQGATSDALGHLLRAHRLADAEDLILHRFDELSGDGGDYVKALSELSRAELAQYPLLLFGRGLFRTEHPATAAHAKEDLVAAAVAAAQQWYDARGLRKAVLGVVIAQVSRLTGRWSAIEEVLAVVESELDASESADPDEFVELRALLRSVVSFTLLRSGLFTRAATVARRVIVEHARPHVPGLVERMAGMLAFQRAITGELVAARTALDISQHGEFRGLLLPGYPDAVHLRLARAILDIEAGDLGAADPELRAVEQQYPTVEHWPEALIVRGWWLAVSGNAAAAAALLTRHGGMMSRYTSASPLVVERVESELAMMEVLGGHSEDAARRLRSLPRHRPLVKIVRATIDLYTGAPERGLSLSSQLSQEPLGARYRVEADVISAAAHWLAGQREQALRLYDRATAIAVVEGLTLPMRTVPQDLGQELFAAWDALPRDLTLVGPRIAALWSHPVGVPLARPSLLTGRERQVMELLSDGYSTAQIAGLLGTSVNTVKTQRRNLYRKLGATCRTQALDRARQLGILGRHAGGTASSH